MRARAFTIAELLTSVAVFAVLTAILAASLFPILKRLAWTDQRQEVLQRLIITRNYLRQRFSNAEFIRADAYSVEYYRPKTIHTNYGRFSQIQDNELTEANSGEVWKLSRNASNQLIDQNIYEPTSSTHVLWNMGSDSDFSIDRSEHPVIWFRFEGLTNPNDQASKKYQRKFSLYCKNFPR